ncbi:unnamed protein product [Rotaria magnacalcarata]
MIENTKSWEDLVIDQRKTNPKFRSRTCCIYNNKSKCLVDPHQLCPCGRMIRSHSFTDDSLEFKETRNISTAWIPPNEFLDNNTHSTQVPCNAFGTLEPTGCKFLRIDNRLPMEDLFQLMLTDCGGKKPALILSIYGGGKYFTIEERLKNEFITGVIDTAIVTNAWILTNGVNNGVSKLVGEGISHYQLLRENPNKVICIGMTMWGTINDNTHLVLKNSPNRYLSSVSKRQIPENIQEDKETIELNHTHCILFDSGRLNEYYSDLQRHQFIIEARKKTHHDHTCYVITIIAEGGLDILEVIENDIKEKRSIILIKGSGRLADALAMLVELTSTSEPEPSYERIKQTLNRFYSNIPYAEIPSTIKRIEKLLHAEFRHLFHVFSMDRDAHISEMIFKAIFAATDTKAKLKHDQSNENESLEQESQRRIDEDKLVDLALEWNYFDGAFPILQMQQSYIVKQKSDHIKAYIARQKRLFLRSLEKNRSTFIEYFLISGFDPLILLEKDEINSYENFITKLYSKSYDAMDTSHKNCVKILFGDKPIQSAKQLDQKLAEFVGPFFESIYSLEDNKFKTRIKIDLSKHLCICLGSQKHRADRHQSETIHNSADIDQNVKIYTKYHVLRDLFLWSVFMDLPEMTEVLILHVQSRICACLIASSIFKKYSKLSQKVDMKHKFQMQSLAFETYAAMSVDKCYEYNERRASELLLRQIPIFGNVTCMQVAISSESHKLLETHCFDHTLRQVWYDKLCLTNAQPSANFSQIPSIFTFGTIAPWIISYRKEIEDSLNNMKYPDLSHEGINYYVGEENSKEGKRKSYWTRFRYFHQSPMIKMSYHFISYIWFLLVFSFMMLYHLDSRKKSETLHWTEVYVIITVSAMSIDEVRRLYHEYDTRMTELWGSTESTMLTAVTKVFYFIPYLLFYLGLGFRYSGDTKRLLSITRVIWAIDLEFWYLRSLKFVIVLKFLGPKLFMLKNMLRDLFAFVYLIFTAIAAYGVASRSLILYNQVPFTINDIVNEILYEPYWFIYGEPSDKVLLDNLIDDGSNHSTPNVAEAAAAHFLLAFHMLFVNILVLNLLIAVFADSIGKVQQNTEFYWRYQRYSFVREYFERIPLSYPPLITIPHIILLVLTIRNKCWLNLIRTRDKNKHHVPSSKTFSPIFKMIPINDSQNSEWDAFENAATYSYVRSIFEQNKDKHPTINDHEKTNITIDSNVSTPRIDQQQDIENFKNELMATVKSVLMKTQKELKQNNSNIESHADQIRVSSEPLTTAMVSATRNSPKQTRSTHRSSSLGNDVVLWNKGTT